MECAEAKLFQIEDWILQQHMKAFNPFFYLLALPNKLFSPICHFFRRSVSGFQVKGGNYSWKFYQYRELDTERKHCLSYMCFWTTKCGWYKKHCQCYCVAEEEEEWQNLNNYVSVYDSHFHYVTINMFSKAFSFPLNKTHTLDRWFRFGFETFLCGLEGLMRRQETSKVIKYSVCAN